MSLDKSYRVPIDKSHMLSPNAPNFPPRKLMVAADGNGFTWHETGNENPWADEDNQAAYVHTTDAVARDVAYHGCVGDIKFCQVLPFDNLGWHAGDGCDNPSSDFGCFFTLGFEMAIPRGYNREQARWNFAQIVARVVLGDPAFDWGDGRTKGKFSIDKNFQHRQVSQGLNRHDCPLHIRLDNAWPTCMQYVDENMVIWEAILHGAVTPPPDPEPHIPAGMTESLLKRLYGSSRGPDGKLYQFNIEGPWSQRWLERCAATVPAGESWTAGDWPQIDQVIVLNDSGKGKRVIQYSDGFVDDGSRA